MDLVKCYTGGFQLPHERVCPRNIVIVHTGLIFIQLADNLFLFTDHAVEMPAENLEKGLAFDDPSEILKAEVFLAHGVPEYAVLRFGVHYDTVQIE